MCEHTAEETAKNDGVRTHPEYDMTAMMAFWPPGRRSKLMRSSTRVRTMGHIGYTIKYRTWGEREAQRVQTEAQVSIQCTSSQQAPPSHTVSMRSSWFMATVPIACLPMAHWYVLRGDCMV